MNKTRQSFLMGILVIAALIFVVYHIWQFIFTDRSILTHAPCSPPCWYGIVPGETTCEDALLKLKRNRFVNPASIREHWVSSQLIGVEWKPRALFAKWRHPGFSCFDGIVNEIEIGLSFDVSAEEILDRFSTPEYVLASSGGTPENWYWIVTLYYPSKGVEFVFYTSEYSALFNPDARLGRAIYFVPTDIQTRIQDEFGNLSSSIFERLHLWKGYGSALDLYP